MNNKRCFLLLSVLTAALLWLAPACTVRAAVYTYNARQRTLNAGVLFVGTASDPAFATTNTPNPVPDPAPYVFYALDHRPDAKPVGWSFVNPLAQNTVTTAMITRWNQAYTTGQSLTPTMAAYWEVPLRDVSADDLQQFDVLYLAASYVVGNNSYTVTFTPADNEKLRRFVDNGGQLIVEYGVGTPAQPQFAGVMPLFDSANWTSFTGIPSLAVPIIAATPNNLAYLHPIITESNLLSPTDLTFLGATTGLGTLTQNTTIFETVLFQKNASAANADAVDAARIGGGQIVTSALNLGPLVCNGVTSATLPTTFSPTAPSSNFKLLSNIISWADTHPNENKTSHQNAAGPSSASYTAAWAFPDPAQNTPLSSNVVPPGVAISGDFVYVTAADGLLHAFDAYPGQDLTQKGRADDQVPVYGSTPNQPTPYGEIWNASVGPNSSAPTVGSHNGSAFVLVEKTNGTVLQFDAVTGTLLKTMTQPNGPTTSYPQLGIFNAPAPTYYEGRVYAGQPNGTLFIYDLNSGGSASGGALIPVNPANGNAASNPETVTAPPAVGLLASGTATNSIIALVPTTQNMNTVLLGARNDPLVGYSPGGQFQGYNVNRNARYSLPNLFVDVGSTPTGRAYDSNGNILGTATGGNGLDPVYPATALPINIDDQFGDWDIDFVKSIPQNGGMTLTLHEIKALSIANTAGGATLSAPAIDRHGDYYYTVYDGSNSYLFGVHDDIAQRNVRLKFRFRLPKTNDSSTVDPTNSGNNWSTANNAVDADNVNYANTTTNQSDGSSRSLLDYHFVGAPVVDGQGNVYVAAQNGNTAAVLSFSADQEVTAEAGTIIAGSPPVFNRTLGYDATQAHYFQLDESSPNPQDPLVAIPLPGRGAGRYGQITTAGSIASVFNFGRGSGGSRQISGNLCEPQPFTGVPNPRAGSNTSATWMYFHTNLAWYATFAVNGQISGLSKAGSTLLLCDSGTGGSGSYNTLYKLPAAPTVAAGKIAALTVQKAPLGTGANGKPLNIGTVGAAPGAGGSAMVVNGTAGLVAFNQQLTLIADNNRILEADADGNAVWSADATTRVGPNGASTRVDFAHPSALAQFAPNDYLVADTGNNRCVRFDRGGSVLWELTRFYDPAGLMAPGQPFTLSQPASVEVRREEYDYTDPVSQKPQKGQLVHYLVADSGNDRIVEVTDTLDPAGNALYFDTNTPPNVVAPGTSGSVTHDHLLTWVTHTGDKYGRHYHYAGASYLDIPSGSNTVPDTISIFALVTNTRVARPAASGGPLGPASADSPGGSIVAFNRPNVAPGPLPFSAITNTTPNDLVYVATSFTAPVTTGVAAPPVSYPVRNPRFLHVYAPPQGVPVTPDKYVYSFLYADDNGAFDLVYQGLTTPPVSYGLAFTQRDYRNMSLVSNVPADVAGNVPLRGGAVANGNNPAIPPIPFVPTCVQRLNDDDTNTPTTSHIERYLITQSYSQGELARQPGSAFPNRLGGEIFEVDVSTLGVAASTVTIDPVGGFGGAVTLSRPVGASPLTQPTFAIRTTQ